MTRKKRRNRGSRARGASPSHWLNLGLTIMVLGLLLLGIQVLGDGTASCFMQITTPPTAGENTPSAPVEPPSLDTSP